VKETGEHTTGSSPRRRIGVKMFLEVGSGL
jgi:hypothetical protein